MNATEAALLGSLIGAAAAVSGSVLTSVAALKTERLHHESKVQAAYVAALRKRSGTAFAQFFRIVQAIEWICWHAVNDPGAVDKRRIESYGDTVNGAYEALLGAMALTASIDLTIYEKMKPILTELYMLESQVAVALRQLKSSRSSAVQTLNDCGSQAAVLRDDLPLKLNHIMTVAETSKMRQSSQ